MMYCSECGKMIPMGISGCPYCKTATSGNGGITKQYNGSNNDVSQPLMGTVFFGFGDMQGYMLPVAGMLMFSMSDAFRTNRMNSISVFENTSCGRVFVCGVKSVNGCFYVLTGEGGNAQNSNGTLISEAQMQQVSDMLKGVQLTTPANVSLFMGQTVPENYRYEVLLDAERNNPLIGTNNKAMLTNARILELTGLIKSFIY